MFCHNCGTPIMPDQKFCRMCGTNVHSLSEGPSRFPADWSPSRRRWQIVVDALADALRTGVEFVSDRPPHEPHGKSPLTRFRRWGIVAFWAGLVALLGDVFGFMLLLAGLGLLIYERGFFDRDLNEPIHQMGETRSPYSRPSIYTRGVSTSVIPEPDEPHHQQSTREIV